MTYLELLAAIAAAEKQHGISDLDHVSREILTTIASANMLRVKIRIKDLAKVATFPTIHIHLAKLIETGWVERLDDESDGRVALLRITPRTEGILRRISETLDNHPEYIRREPCESCISKVRALAFSEFERKYREFEREFKQAGLPTS
jgi:DNA-binding MarR family transcriptional regulator